MSGKNRRRGVSSVLGIVIAIGILITAVVPLWLFQTSTEMIQRQAIEGRIQVDKERLDESLELKAYEDWYMGTHEIILKIRNTCYLTITVVRIYVTPRNDPLKPPIETYITLPPNTDPLEMSTGVVAQSETVYDIKVVSERGNIYVPLGGPIYGGSGRAYPNTLSVTVINMRKGLDYFLNITAISTGEEDPPEYFPVAMSWHATSDNEFQTLAFGISPGTYLVSIADSKGWSESRVVDCTSPYVSNPTVVWDCSRHENKTEPQKP